MNHICKRVLSASLSLVLVGSLSYGTVLAAFRQDIPSIKGDFTNEDMSVCLTDSMIYASKNIGTKILVALYDQNGKMTSLQQFYPDKQNNVVLSGTGVTYKIFCLNDKWASVENSYRTLRLDVVYGNKNHSIEHPYDTHYDLRDLCSGLMSQNNTILSLGLQEFLKSLQCAGYLDAQGNILSDSTFDRGKFIFDNWNKIFDRFEGYVSAEDNYYTKFKGLLSLDNFITKTISDSGVTTYSLNHTGFSATLAGCAEYLTPKFRDLVLAGYDVMINSKPATGVSEDDLIDRIATILESRLIGVTADASNSIQSDGNDTSTTLTKEDFIHLANLLRKDRATQNRTIEIISVIESLGADRLNIQKTIDADTLASNAIRIFNVTDQATKEKLNELFSKFPSRNLRMILDLDTASSQTTTQPTTPDTNPEKPTEITPPNVITAFKNASSGFATISYNNQQMTSIITTLKYCIDTALSESSAGTVITKEYVKTRFVTDIQAIKNTYLSLGKNNQSRIINDIANSINLSTLNVIQEYFLS